MSFGDADDGDDDTSSSEARKVHEERKMVIWSWRTLSTEHNLKCNL